MSILNSTLKVLLEPPRRAAKRLPVSWKTALGAAVCQPLVGRVIGAAFAQRIPCQGIPIDTRGPHVADRTRAQLFWGMYESAELRSLRRHLEPDCDVVELGSSLGVVSCHASARLSPSQRMVCVEANPRLVPLLSANLTANAPGRSIVVVQRAVDYESSAGEIELELGAESTGGRVANGRGAPGERETVKVGTTTLSEILAANHLEAYTLIADIEGAEAGIFIDDAAALRSCRRIIAELHATVYRGVSYTPEALAALLEARGFRVLGRDGGVWSLESGRRP